MRKEENSLEVTLSLPKNFHQEIADIMHQEFVQANKKWGLSLNSDHEAQIAEKAWKQLTNKVSSVARRPWEPTSQTLVVMVSTNKKGVFKLTLPSKEAAKYTVALVRAHDEWRVEQDPNHEAVKLSDFYEYFTEEVKTWARTAIFYGVGSYT